MDYCRWEEFNLITKQSNRDYFYAAGIQRDWYHYVDNVGSINNYCPFVGPPNSPFTPTYTDIWNNAAWKGLISKISMDGTVLSTWLYGDPSEIGSLGLPKLYTFIRDVQELPDSSVVIIGQTERQLLPGAEPDFTITRFNPQNDDILWNLRFGDFTSSSIANSMDLALNNDLLIAGNLVLPADPLEAARAQYLRLDQDGNVIFRKYWHTGAFSDQFIEILSLNDGFLCFGFSDVLNPAEQNLLPVVARFNNSGDLLWSYVYDVDSYVDSDSDNDGKPDGYFGGGYVDYDNNIYFVYTDQDTIPATGIRLIKLNELGDVVWSNKYFSTLPSTINNVSSTHNGNLILTGSLSSGQAEYGDGLLLEITQDGEIWNSRIFDRGTQTRIDDVIAIEENNCEGFLAVGSRRLLDVGGLSPTSFDIRKDPVVLKLNKQIGSFSNCSAAGITFTKTSTVGTAVQRQFVGAIGDAGGELPSTHDIHRLSGRVLTDTILCPSILAGSCITTDIDDNDLPKQIQTNFFPNPSTGSIRISGPAVHQIKIFDLLGEQVAFEIQGRFHNSADIVLNSEPGMYLIQSQTKTGEQFTGKFLIQRP
jgi:hypothetical protein